MDADPKHRNFKILLFVGLAILLTWLVYSLAGPHIRYRPEWLKWGFSAFVGIYLAYQPIRFGRIVRKARKKGPGD